MLITILICVFRLFATILLVWRFVHPSYYNIIGCSAIQLMENTIVGCAFLTYFNPESAATAAELLHEKQTLPGVSKQTHIR